MTEKTRGSFSSSEGSQTISYARWVGSDAIQGIMLIAHGMAEYIDRYDAFAEFFTERGWAVYGNDHLGHGMSALTEQDLGYFADKGGADLVVRDIYTLYETALKEFPGRPVVLLGHSMGSFVARVFCNEYPDALNGAIFMGSGGRNPALAPGRAIAGIAKFILGGHSRSRFIDSLAFGAYNKKYENPKTTFDWLNTDGDKVMQYMDDPLCGYLFTLSGFCDLFTLTSRATRKGWTSNIPVDLPVLIVSGSEDPVGNFGKGVREIYSDLHQRGVTSLSMILYDGMRHEILNEPDCQRVRDDILEWCDQILGIERPEMEPTDQQET